MRGVGWWCDINPTRPPEGVPCRELEHQLLNVVVFSSGKNWRDKSIDEDYLGIFWQTFVGHEFAVQSSAVDAIGGTVGQRPRLRIHSLSQGIQFTNP